MIRDTYKNGFVSSLYRTYSEQAKIMTRFGPRSKKDESVSSYMQGANAGSLVSISLDIGLAAGAAYFLDMPAEAAVYAVTGLDAVLRAGNFVRSIFDCVHLHHTKRWAPPAGSVGLVGTIRSALQKEGLDKLHIDNVLSSQTYDK